MKCLFVEDEVIKPVDPIVRYLTINGFEVDIAEDGSTAIKKLKSEKYDVILLDINLERSDDKTLKDIRRAEVGLNILRRIKGGEFEEAGNKEDIPVVVLSSVILKDVMDQIKRLILEEFYLIKPVDPDIIVEKVKKASKT